MNLLGYARVSFKSETEGLHGQVERLQRWADLHEHEIEIREEMVSGKKGAKRPVFDNVMEDLLDEDSLLDGLVVDSQDRFARSTQDTLFKVNQLEEAGKFFFTVRFPIDTSTPMGKFFFVFLAAQAEFERTIVYERMRLGRERAKALGKQLGGRKPIELPRDAIMRDRKLGASLRFLADKYGVSLGTIRSRLRKWGGGVGTE